MIVEEKKKLTYDDYAQLPEGAPYQLIDGELVMEPAPTPYHQGISMGLSYALYRFVRERGLGTVLTAPVDVYLGPHHTFQPDVLFLSNERLGQVGEKRIDGAPDLVVEILSPTSGYHDMKTKKRVYEETGVREYWIVDPFEKSVEVYENTGSAFVLLARAEGAATVASKVLGGFTLALADVF